MLLQSDEERGIRQIVSGSMNHSVVLVIFAGLELKHYKTEKKLGPSGGEYFSAKRQLSFLQNRALMKLTF